MSEFLNNKLNKLNPYVPGEQPNRFEKWIKLNTNESPFPPSLCVNKVMMDYYYGDLRLYPNPDCDGLLAALSDEYKVDKEQLIVGNGSDELLAFSFMGFCEKGAAFPDITYGFYKVFSGLFNATYKEIKLNVNLGIDVNDYKGLKETVVIANPNAPTGLELSRKEIIKLLEQDKNRLVIIDEAYVDFGGTSSVDLIDEYNNLLIIGTFSKSRNLAGARIGYAISNKEVIKDLYKIKYSFNPYNVNSLSSLMGEAALRDSRYFESCIERIKNNREYITDELNELGFEVVNSKANFILVKCKETQAKKYYEKLKEKGILVRYFDIDRLKDYVRITIGSKQELELLLKTTREII
jgi:histidinol-phosphate aminotransferase